jgi:hypothetical protein
MGMHSDESCPNCRATLRLDTQTQGFLSFECPKCAFVVIKVAKENVPQGRTVGGRH